MINNSMIVAVKGVKYSKVVLDGFVRENPMRVAHHMDTHSYESGWTYEHEFTPDERAGMYNYASSYEEVAQLSGLDYYEVVVRYLNGSKFSEFENDKEGNSYYWS